MSKEVVTVFWASEYDLIWQQVKKYANALIIKILTKSKRNLEVLHKKIQITLLAQICSKE